MTRTWLPDPGWTGTWSVPELLARPITERERGGLVALSREGFGPKQLATAIAKAEWLDDVLGDFASKSKGALAALERLDARALIPADEEYPDHLKAIDAAPPLLFVPGARLDSLGPCVAIVGARACTTGAARFAERLGASFAAAGFVVVSGLARGIDAAAHAGALTEGRTIAVLGTGLDVTYPAEHAELAAQIVEDGAIVTEFPLGVGPRAWHFPARNRIIAGLSIALVIVEAGTISGALITAGFAMDQGREVFACTTGPENPAGAGVRELLLDGARLVVDPDQAVADVLEIARVQGYEAEDVPPPSLRSELQIVYDAVGQGATTDDIVDSTDLDVRRVTSALAELELDGLVRCHRARWHRR